MTQILSKNYTDLIETNVSGAIENIQGFKIACIEEIALNNKWVKISQINPSIKFYGNCDYSKYLAKLI